MEKTKVYLYEEQISDLFKKNFESGDFLKGIAYSFDKDSVFHANTKVPIYKTPSVDYPCYFQFVQSMDIKSKKSNLISGFVNELINKKLEKFLVISLALDGETLIYKALLVNHQLLIDLDIQFIPKTGDLYSRSKGLIETDILNDKKVGIIGLGSGGSQIATELAKAGVGKFYLYDFDRLELSNISRHTCGIDDIGRFKTLAVKEEILNKNPNAEVNTFEININDSLDLFRESVKNTNLIICASDTTRSRFNINQISISCNITSLFGRAITRAAGGDVLRVRPNVGPCLNCLFGQGIIGKEEEEYSQVRQVKQELPAYTSENEINSIIQVGLSTDILPISIMIVKLALVELSKGKESGIKSLEEDLVSDFYIWANRREKIYSNWPKMEYNFTKQTILRWYGARVKKDENCTVCGSLNSNLETNNIFK